MRKLVGALAAVAAMAVLTACGSSESDASGGGPWTFTDGRGEKISLDSAPTRVVAQSSIAAALADLGVEVVGTFGPLKLPDGSVDPQAAGLDPATVTDVTGGGEYGTLDLEKLAELEPDLVITNMYQKPELWYMNDDTAEKVDKVAPILAINYQGLDLVQTLDAVEKVAGRLGADLESAKAVTARQQFADASARLTALGRTMGDRTVLPVSTTADLLYVGDPAQFPDIAYYRSIGLPMAEVTPAKDSYWDELSWEKSDTYDADIALWDDRIGEAGLADLKKQPVFGTITAAKNDAYVPWAAVTPAGYSAYARVINTLTDNLEKNL
ncbi:ABC transporter substrate-binding protein [Aeromicrobium endophyticum]|uniref:ABC transporter substrate-binding protein n=1 Tax=Aeromicrobium endophyticum TaxID=2292704 RepID=A0A371P8V4_9ACTN|nr:ABC transporter substrate-binding protein [Aeromicrobium endophyticum]REK72332.1 ABC transporter substrate-binding protein [Aeromicrobium endophyticum]